jgi:uncharacterized membrane protein YidH (DUF202 family)
MTEPDVRSSLADQLTLLAYERTAIPRGVLVCGVAAVLSVLA